MTDPLRVIERRQQRDIDLLYATLGDAIRNAVADVSSDQVFTTMHRDAILREVDAGLSVIWGHYPGDPDAALRQIVQRDTRAARFGPLDDSVRRWRKAMDADLLSRVEDEAGIS
jgi:hypothetical protein